MTSRTDQAKVEPGTPMLAIVGPTAVGKSAVAHSVAPALGAEIVSVDSMQIYRGMDIGTSKPAAGERGVVRFHMIDVADPSSEFSVAQFKRLADTAVVGIIARGRVPLLVGGSGLYYRAVVDDLDFANAGDSDEFRVEVDEELAELSDIELHSVLADLDPSAASEIPPANRRRVSKALGVARRGARLISDRQSSWRDFDSPYDLRVAGLDMERELLYELIDRRVDSMMAAGLEGEVRRLRQAGLRRGTTAGEALGYRQLLDHLDGRQTHEEAVGEIKARTRNYAKRQLTWFRKDPRVRWFRVEGGPGDPTERVYQSLERTAGLVLEYLSDKLEN